MGFAKLCVNSSYLNSFLSQFFIRIVSRSHWAEEFPHFFTTISRKFSTIMKKCSGHTRYSLTRQRSAWVMTVKGQLTLLAVTNQRAALQAKHLKGRKVKCFIETINNKCELLSWNIIMKYECQNELVHFKTHLPPLSSNAAFWLVVLPPTTSIVLLPQLRCSSIQPWRGQSACWRPAK